MLLIFRLFSFFVMFFEFGLFSPSPSSTALLTSRVEDPVWISWSGPNKRASVDFWNRNNKGVDTFFWTSRVVSIIRVKESPILGSCNLPNFGYS